MNGNGAHVTDGGVWTNGSSRTFKTDFQAIDGQEVLDKLAGLSITDWRYKGEDASRTSGPVAEDFSEAFGLGGDEKYIGTVDADGVTMAAVQALYELVKQQQKRSTCSKRSYNNREMAPIMRTSCSRFLRGLQRSSLRDSGSPPSPVGRQLPRRVTR